MNRIEKNCPYRFAIGRATTTLPTLSLLEPCFYSDELIRQQLEAETWPPTLLWYPGTVPYICLLPNVTFVYVTYKYNLKNSLCVCLKCFRCHSKSTP